MDEAVAAAAALLSDVGSFCLGLLEPPLYRYQLEPLYAVFDSIRQGSGREFLLIFPRQSGKNEAVAQFLVYLLNLFRRRGGNIVYGATGDALGRGRRRLEARLDNEWNSGLWKRTAQPVRRELGRAAVVFLSTHPQAASRGETAHWLLVIDELQEHAPAHLEAVFEPMRAAHNASALYIGTVGHVDDALWQKKEELEAAEAADGVRRVFIVPPEAVIAENPSYGRFLEEKVARLGRDHPIVASEYFNEPIDGHSGLFDERRLALMGGYQHRQRPNRTRPSKQIVVATLDVAGQDEAATDGLARLANPGRDYTVAHVFSLRMLRPDDPGPTYLALDVFVDQGSRHFQDAPGRPRLADRLLAWLQAWNVRHLVADESGVGAGLVDYLAARLGRRRVTGYNFATRHGKAALGSAFLAVVETGRFRYWSSQRHKPGSAAWWFFTQAAACTSHLPEGGRFERDLQWGVPKGATTTAIDGRPRPIHDDRLLSAALVAVYDELYRQGALRLGQAASAVIAPTDALDDAVLRF